MTMLTSVKVESRGARGYAELFERPLLIAPRKLQMMCDIVHARITSGGGGDADTLERELAVKQARREGAPWPHGSMVSQVSGGESPIVDGVAIVPIHGIIRARGETGYDGIASETFCSTIERRRELELCLADPSVRAILLDIDSPGGSCAGTFELADFIHESRGEKPIWAHCNGLAASAAYAIASSASRVLVTRTSECGHVGTYIAMLQVTGALESAGIRPIVVSSSELKTAGHPYVEQDEARVAELQRIVDEINAQFIATVARGRGMDEAAVLATEARLFVGGGAVEAGFADEVMGFEAALAALAEGDALRTTGAPSRANQFTHTVQFTRTEPGEGDDAARAATDGDTTMALLKKRPKANSPKNGPKGMDEDDEDEDEHPTADRDPNGPDSDLDPDGPDAMDDDDNDDDDPQAVRRAERTRVREITKRAEQLGFDPGCEMVERLLDSGASVEKATSKLFAAAGERPRRRSATKDPTAAMRKGVPDLVGQTTVTPDAGGDGAGGERGEPASYEQALAMVIEEHAQAGIPISKGEACRRVNRQWPALYQRTQKASMRLAPSR